MVTTSSPQQKPQTPLQYKKIFLLGMILIANNTSMWMIFSFLPFMVKFYYPLIPEHEFGYKSGMLGAAYSAGGLLGNVLWGAASDRYGRRPALLGGLLGTALSAICFGFSPTYSFAVLSRFIWGILNGNIGVTKTYLGEISDDTNSARGMALYGVIGGSGRIFGPLLGGLLYDPARLYPAAFRPFEHFPFALPALFVAIYCFCMLPFVAALLPETLAAARKDSDAEANPSPMAVCSQLLRRALCMQTAKDSSQHSPIPIYSASASSSPRRALSALASFLCGASSAGRSSAPSSRASAPSAAAPSSLAGSTGVVDQRLPPSYFPLSTEEPLSPQPSQVRSLQHCDAAESYEEDEEARDGLEMGLLLRDKPSSDALATEQAARSQPQGVLSKRRVCFLNQVTVKIIDEPGLTRSPLKQIRKEDVPLPWRSRGGSPAPAAADVEAGLRKEADQVERAAEDGDEDEEREGERERDGDGQDGSDEAEDFLLYSNGSELVADSGPPPATLATRLKQLLRRREILISVLLYGLGALCVTLTAEIFPLWVVTAESEGGLGYGPEHIGLATTLCGAGSVAVQLLLYPRMVEGLGVLRVFKLGAVLFAAASLLLPSSVPLAGALAAAASFLWSGGGGGGGEWTARALALILQFTSVVSSNWMLISVFVLINNSCYSHQRATVNGIGQTFASLGRLLGPLFGAPLFAWSEGNGLSWPLNFCLTWYLLCALTLSTAQMSSFLPRSIERQKREPRPSKEAALSDFSSSTSGGGGGGTGRGQGAGIAAKNSDDENEPSPPHPHPSKLFTESDGGGGGQISPILRNLRRPKPSPFAEPVS